MLTLADISAQAFPYLNLCAAFVIEAVSLCRKCSDTGLNFGWLLVVFDACFNSKSRKRLSKKMFKPIFGAHGWNLICMPKLHPQDTNAEAE